MRGRPSEVLPGALIAARRRIEAWRSRRERGSRIPAHLWMLAVDLARVDGASRTATTLGLDYYGLKRRPEQPIFLTHFSFRSLRGIAGAAVVVGQAVSSRADE